MIEKIKVCLINPPVSFKPKPLEEWSNNSIHNFPYLGIRYLESALIDAGFAVDIFDCPCEEISIKQLIKDIKNNQYKYIGLSMFYYNLMNCERILSYLNVLDAFIFVGGYAATLDYEKILISHPQINCVILGDGEEIITDLFNNISKKNDWSNTEGIAFCKNGKVSINMKKSIKDLDEYSFPQYKLYKKCQTATIVTSRGCYGNCSFCSEKQFYSFQCNKSSRSRSVSNVMKELDDIVKRCNPDFVSICDSNFMPRTQSRRKWLLEFFSEVSKRNYNVSFRANTRANDIIFYEKDLPYFIENGLDSFFIGIESFNQRQLDYYNKMTTVEENIEAINILKKLQCKIEIGFLILEPYVTLKEIFENLTYLINLDLYEFLDYNQSFFSQGATLFSIKGTKICEDINDLGISQQNDIGYMFLNPDVQKYYDNLKKWSDFLDSFNYIRYLIDKCLYFRNKKIYAGLMKLLSEIRKCDVDYMLVSITDMTECTLIKAQNKVNSLISDYKKIIDYALNNF